MEANKTLKTLTLNKCRLNSSLTQLAQSLKRNHTLATLYLWGNEFDQTACKAFHELFKDHNNGAECDASGYITSEFLKTDFELYIVDGVYQVAEVSVTAVN